MMMDLESLLRSIYGDSLNTTINLLLVHLISTLAKGFTQLTDGSLSEMTPEEFKKKMDYVEDLLESLKKDPSDIAVASEDEFVDEMMDQLEDMKDIVEGDNRSREVDQILLKYMMNSLKTIRNLLNLYYMN